MTETRPPLPPYSAETAAKQASGAEDAWNTQDRHQVSLAYAVDSWRRSRSESLTGREAIVARQTLKWAGKHEYRPIKEVRAFHENRIAARFANEWHDEAKQWFRSDTNEQGGIHDRRVDALPRSHHRRRRNCRISARVPLAVEAATQRTSGPFRTRSLRKADSKPRDTVLQRRLIQAEGVSLSQFRGSVGHNATVTGVVLQRMAQQATQAVSSSR